MLEESLHGVRGDEAVMEKLGLRDRVPGIGDERGGEEERVGRGWGRDELVALPLDEVGRGDANDLGRRLDW